MSWYTKHLKTGAAPLLERKDVHLNCFAFFWIRNGQLEALFAGKTGMDFGRIMSRISKRLADAQQLGARKPEIAARRIERGFIFGLEEKKHSPVGHRIVNLLID